MSNVFRSIISCNSSFKIKDIVSLVEGPTRTASYLKLQQQSFNSSPTSHLYFHRLQDYGTPSLQWTKIMEHTPSSGLRLWNVLPSVDQDYGMPSLRWTNITECPPSSGPRLWNTLPPVEQDYGTHSFQWTKIMECPPSNGPRLWNALP